MKNRYYYCSLIYLLVRVGPAILIFTLVFTLIAYCLAKGRTPLDPYTIQVVTFTSIFTVIVLAVSFFIYVRLFPLTITSWGIIGHNKNGRKQKLMWEEMQPQGLVRSSGLPCYKLASVKSGNYILIPTFLRKFEDCKKTILDHGIDLLSTKYMEQSSLKNYPAERTNKPKIEPEREGSYIVISTARSSWK